MSRYAVYGKTRIHITDDSITSTEVLVSMTQAFPELKGATVLEKQEKDCTELHLIPLSKMKQHQFDIENSMRQAEKLNSKLQDLFKPSNTALSIKTGTIQANTITGGHGNRRFPLNEAGYAPAHADDKRRMSEYYAHVAEIRERKSTSSGYVHDILDKYATRGGYEHLVGKKAKIISENTDLEIYTIEVEGDDTQYVIRMKDIQKR